MKKIFLFTILFFFSGSCLFSQTANATYFLKEWSQRSVANPSFAPEYGYFTLPVLGGINMSVNTSAGMSSFIYPSGNDFVTFLHSSVTPETFNSKLNKDFYLSQALNLNLLSFGFYTPSNSFWSFGLQLKENAQLILPIELFRLAKLGMVSSTANHYDLKALSFQQSNYLQSSLTYSREINTHFRIGVGLKLLLGLPSVRFNYSKFDVNLADSRYEVNALGQAILLGNMISIPVDADNNYNFGETSLKINELKVVGRGFAFDLGATYTPIDKLSIAFAFTDIGNLKWEAQTVNKGVSTTNLSFSGLQGIDLDSLNIDDEEIQNLITDAQSLLHYKKATVSESFYESIPFTLNFSAEYALVKAKNFEILFGLLWNHNSANNYVKNNFVSALTIKPFSWFTLSGTAELLGKDANRYGLALNFSPRWINLYIASDFITPKLNANFLPIDRINANISLGGSFVLGKSMYREK